MHAGDADAQMLPYLPEKIDDHCKLHQQGVFYAVLCRALPGLKLGNMHVTSSCQQALASITCICKADHAYHAIDWFMIGYNTKPPTQKVLRVPSCPGPHLEHSMMECG